MPAVFYVVIALFLTGPLFAADPEPPRRVSVGNRLYELRMIQATPGKLAALHALLRDHQIPLLEEHAVFTQGVFVPAGENPDQRVYVLVAAEGPGPMQDGWAGFRDDPKWLQALSKSEKAIAGKLVQQEGSKRLVQTYWSPEFTPLKSPEPRVFELRTYTCPDHEKQMALQRRFREHTMKLFEKHGMQNLVYWTPKDEPDSLTQLVYLLTHKSQDSAKESFSNFRKDPDWLAAKDASEKKAGGSLTAKEKGVVSEFLTPTEYSPLK